MMDSAELMVRRAIDSDRDAIVAVCQASLGWKPGDPNADFFSWKHDSNSFGPSPMWVAEDDGELIGVRVFLNWRFRDTDGSVFTAVRAVDTATSPKAQGRGVFKRLTLGAIPDLQSDGVGAVFNTPNDKSRPGYLKMGWQDVGRVPVAVRVRNPLTAPRLLGANTAASKWSTPTEFGVDAAEAFADADHCASLLASMAPPTKITTDRDAAYLAWRYSFGPLHYRVMMVNDKRGHGAIVFRVRQRGSAQEVAICDIIGPPGLGIGRALGDILRGTGADYLVVGSGSSGLRAGCIPVSKLGPKLTWRSIVRPGTPTLDDLNLAVGDVELF